MYDIALAEIRAGAKRSHWMWFVFPQIAGLGISATAQHYAVSGAEEARAYLNHAILGERLLEITAAAGSATGDATDVFGTIDAMKLRSSMTLFAAVSADPAPFRAVIDRFFDGKDDPATIDRLR